MTVGELRHSMSRRELLQWSSFLRWEAGEDGQNDMMKQLNSFKTKGGIQ